MFKTGMAGDDSGGGGAVYSNSETIPALTQIVSVVFPAIIPTIDYQVFFTIENTVDLIPQFLIGLITEKTVNGFSITFNAPTDSGDYLLNWGVFLDA